MHTHGRPGIPQFEVHACLPMLQPNNDLEQPGARGHLPDSHTSLILENSLAKGFGIKEDSPILRGMATTPEIRQPDQYMEEIQVA